jgi:hypothetical protein
VFRSGTLDDVFRHLPIRGEVAFLKGKKFSEKIKKQQLITLEPLVDDLKFLLEPGEEILLAARGVSPFSFMEQLTTGWAIFYLKRCILVLTDRRLLHIPTRFNYKSRNSMAQVRLADIKGVKGGGKLTISYKNGSRESFYYLKNGKRLRRLIEPMLTASAHTSAAAARFHLCPKCGTTLLPDRWQCAQCRLQFKDRRSARLYSIWLPGGGYFYTRHPWLGIADAFAELVLIALTFLFLGGYFLRPEQFGTEDLVLGGLFALALIFEKWVAVYHASHFVKEYIPSEKSFTRLPNAVVAQRATVVDTHGEEVEEDRVSFS